MAVTGSAELTLNEWQTGGHQERSNITAQLCPGIHKQQITFQTNKFKESINVVHIFSRLQIYDVPHIEGEAVLGGCHHCHSDNYRALVGLAGLELQWNKYTVPAEVTCMKLSQKPGKSQCTSLAFSTRPKQKV